jgi:tetratricopeptide (TPR) repeat protein
MKKTFPPAIKKCSALFLLCGVASIWFLPSDGLSGEELLSASSDSNAESYLKSGIRDLKSGACQPAIDKFTKAIQLDPSFALAYDARATARCRMKDYAGAIRDCDEVIGLTHRDEHVNVIEGACRFYLHDVQGALKLFNTAASINPDDPLARVLRGLILAGSGEWNGTITDFNTAIELDPDDAMAYYGRASVDFFFKEYEKSLANVSRAIQLDSALSDAYGLRAEVKAHLKDRTGAFADANARIKLDISNDEGNDSSDKAYAGRAKIEAMWDDFPDASNDLQTAIQINPANAEIYLIRGMMNQKRGNFQAAMADYSRGSAGDTEPVQCAETCEAIAYAHAEMSQWQPALESFRKAIAFKSSSDDAPFQIFLIECRMGQTEQAKKELAAYIQSIPAAKAGDWTTCIAHFLAGTLNETSFLAQTATTAKRPTDVALQTGDAWYYAGMQHLLAGDKPGALKRFKKCLKVGDDNSDNYTMAKSILGKY